MKPADVLSAQRKQNQEMKLNLMTTDGKLQENCTIDQAAVRVISTVVEENSDDAFLKLSGVSVLFSC